MINLECVPISMYCRETGEGKDVVEKRLRNGIWQEGNQVLKIAGVKEKWIDLVVVAEWARQAKKVKEYEPNWAALD
ncbi:excisionase [Pantoea sp. Acro-805]|uniref:Excisionase n=1 Tax=Candidatus Pantoea formicae TaxID=2608355 RepID=A0ABX0R2A4_9GAMM|nr:excisionase [Pantoea formicae]NIF02100.1 excisionase [Pantoea formicae]